MCTCPNYMIFDGRYNHSTGNPKLIFVPHVRYESIVTSGVPYIQVPCGKCLECRLQYTRSWADRCVLESKNSKHNYFITLTYNDESLPENGSLCERDVTLFLKRLRKKLGCHKFKYFYCGEYGDTTLRPHYHLILFDVPLNDLTYEFKSIVDGQIQKDLLMKRADLMYSETIWSLWYRLNDDGIKQSLGNISVGRFSFDTACYVAQYVTKKINGKMEKFYKEFNVVPEFLRMSKGIGKSAFNDDLYLFDNIVVASPKGAHVASIPRYFDKLFIKKYGEDIFNDSVRIKRLDKKFQGVINNLNSSIDYDTQNKIKDYNANKRQRIKTQL